MSKQKILVFDDQPSTAERWVADLEQQEAVEERFLVKPACPSDFRDAIAGLQKRRKAARTSIGGDVLAPNAFDDVAILVVDYDLLYFDEAGELTGESVAYLARCYSRCGLIIGVNQFGVYNFDLTLKGHPDSFADLNLGHKHLANRGLWSEPFRGFRPWYWPLLPKALSSFEKCVARVVEKLDEPILEFLGFPVETVRILPTTARDFLTRTTRRGSPELTTFRQFVENSGEGLRGRRDRTIDDRITARIAVARLKKWLELHVLAGQDILVDAPHLVSRFPSLLGGDIGRIREWNQTASFSTVGRLGLRHQIIADHRFKSADWLSREAWFWRGVSECPNVEEVRNPWSVAKPDFVFCEDVSRFVPKAAARGFMADLPSQYVRRYVVDPDSNRARSLAKAVAGVRYDPVSRLTM